MSPAIWVLGEALMDCVAQPDGSLRPCMGGSPFNLARAAALRGAQVGFINPLSSDLYGAQMRAQFALDGVQALLPPSTLPTSLAVVQLQHGQPSYGFYREGIADRDYQVEQVLNLLAQAAPGVLHTGSLVLVPPESDKVLAILRGAKRLGWTLSVDVNLRPLLAHNLALYLMAVAEAAALADWLKASDEDLALLGYPGADLKGAAGIAQDFKANGASRVALTFGRQGAWLDVDGEQAGQAAPAITVLDTVGAGDTFWGNCLADWVLAPEGAAGRVASTLQQAMHAAAINCTRQGCQPPTPAEVAAFGSFRPFKPG